jgi:hypothetical protein
MADIVFNVAKGRVGELAALGAANDALVLVLLKQSGIETDAVLRDYDTLSAVLAAANDEADFTGYGRRTLASTTVTVDDTNDRVDVDSADPAAWTNTGGASQQTGAAIICYDNDTTGGTDANLIPLVKLDYLLTFDVGVPTTLIFNAAGWYRAA